jgi:hypothetical protein
VRTAPESAASPSPRNDPTSDNTPPGQKNEPLFLLLLARGHSIRSAARRANIPEKTAQRKARRPEFHKQVDAVREELIRCALGQLVASQRRAEQTLRELLGATSEPIRLGAAKAVLDSTMKLREQVVLAEQLAETDRKIEELVRVQVEELEPLRAQQERLELLEPTLAPSPPAAADPVPVAVVADPGHAPFSPPPHFRAPPAPPPPAATPDEDGDGWTSSWGEPPPQGN